MLTKLKHLQRPCAYLHRHQAVSPAAFRADETLQLAIERALHEGIEACLHGRRVAPPAPGAPRPSPPPLGRHLLADAGAGLLDTNRGVFLALAQQRIAPGWQSAGGETTPIGG